MLGSPVPMVPTSETGASVVKSYLRFEFFIHKRDRDIELEREREREIPQAKKTVAALGALLGRVRSIQMSAPQNYEKHSKMVPSPGLALACVVVIWAK